MGSIMPYMISYIPKNNNQCFFMLFQFFISSSLKAPSPPVVGIHANGSDPMPQDEAVRSFTHVPVKKLAGRPTPRATYPPEK